MISSPGIGVVRDNLMELGGDERQVIDDDDRNAHVVRAGPGVAEYWSCPALMDGLGLRRVYSGHRVSFRIRLGRDNRGPSGGGTDCRSLR